MIICQYTNDKQQEWDDFVKESKNGTFLFLRAYMEYHADRFIDHSLMFYKSSSCNSNAPGKLMAVLPANHKDDILYSHLGLTYGGFVLSPKAHIADVGEMFSVTMNYLCKHGIRQWYYKQIPTVYHRLPSEEDTYWLWRNDARQIECNMMSAIDLTKDTPLSSRKRTYCNRLQKEGYRVVMNAPLTDFWPILTENLMERFETTPVHSLEEITMLQERFPENIVCVTVQNPAGDVVGGTLLFVTDRVVRTQYISASHEGKRCNALDFLMLSLTDIYRRKEYRYLEFGTSMADDAISLNEGLILQKEGFGGRSIACRTWMIDIK